MLDFSPFPHVELCHRPTPIERLPRVSELLGGPRVWIKRDDCTGLAGGGNKTRKLEFLIGDALERGADMVVTQGAVQSNHVRQTAAAACRHGLACHALLERRVPHTDHQYDHSGNVLLDRLYGISIEYRDGTGLDMNAEAERSAERLRAEGRRPYVIPGGGSNEVGALGYALCASELTEQCESMGVEFDCVVVATGSTGTQAGLVAGLHALGSALPVMGISVRQPRERQETAVHDLAERTARRLGAPGVAVGAVQVDDGYVGEGYGIPADSTLEAISLAARLEGILLDPVYSGKGFAGLAGLARAGAFDADQDILFLHTGGAAALFAYERALETPATQGLHSM